MGRRAERVFAYLDALVGDLPAPRGHLDLLRFHLEEGRAQAAASPALPAIQLPFLAHGAIAGEEDPALPVAGASTLLYLGADLLDNLADHELPARWRAWDPALANLAAATYLSALPQISLARLADNGAPAERLWALVHLFAGGLLAMSAGQHEDLLLAGRENVAPEACRAVAERKSGSEFGLFARAGAVLATDNPRIVEAYAGFGLCFGTAAQIASDLGDVWGEQASRDLSNGKRTLPIVHALATLSDEEGERLRRLLAAARGSSASHAEIRKTLEAAGSLRYAALVVEVYRHRALAYLRAAHPREPYGRTLRALLDGASLLPRERDDRIGEDRSSTGYGVPR